MLLFSFDESGWIRTMDGRIHVLAMVPWFAGTCMDVEPPSIHTSTTAAVVRETSLHGATFVVNPL